MISEPVRIEWDQWGPTWALACVMAGVAIIVGAWLL